MSSDDVVFRHETEQASLAFSVENIQEGRRAHAASFSMGAKWPDRQSPLLYNLC